MEAVLILVLLMGFVGALGGVILLGAQFPRTREFAWQPMQGNPVPFRRCNFLFSKAERSFYQALRSLVPDHMIFVKVRLADLVRMKPSGGSFWEHFSPINRKHVDFVVCDPTLAPVLAIELDETPSGLSQDDLVKSVLASASLPILRIPEKRYQFADLRSLLAPYLHVPAPLL
jgi:hypothetical protein